jgi:hypothetical protein
MAVSLNIWQRLSYLLNGDLRQFGSIEKPVSISINNNAYQKTVALTNATNTTIYNNNLGTFSSFYLASDQNTRVLITDNALNSFSLTLRGTGTANEMGVALVLGSDKTVNANTYITTVQVFNNSGSTSNIICVAGK